MIKEIKYLIFFFIIVFFIFFTTKYYFSDSNKKKAYRTLNNFDNTKYLVDYFEEFRVNLSKNTLNSYLKSVSTQ